MIQSGYFIAGLDKLAISLSPATIVVVLFVRQRNSLAQLSSESFHQMT